VLFYLLKIIMVIGIIIFAKIITFFYLFTIDLWIDKLLDGFVP